MGARKGCGQPGVRNTGGGGGGNNSAYQPTDFGGSGGPGVVIVRYTPPNVVTPAVGMTRYNTDGNFQEIFDGTYWKPLVRTVVSYTAAGSYVFNVPKGINNVDVLVVAGGGSGGSRNSGGWYTVGNPGPGGNGGTDGGAGGGAGGMVEVFNYPVIPGSQVRMHVGAGGLAPRDCNAQTPGRQGQPSGFGDLIAVGGGFGGCGPGGPIAQGGNGGSGGGGGGGGTGTSPQPGGLGIQSNLPGFSGTYGYGFRGGNNPNVAPYSGSGGGGAGGVGGQGGNGNVAVGGAGRASSISGAPVIYAGGGGGGGGGPGVVRGGAGGSGGGGNGGFIDGTNSAYVDTNGQPGSPGLGGGGGGGAGNNPGVSSPGTPAEQGGFGGHGGSGVVIVRY
jgi:hypothetical protein